MDRPTHVETISGRGAQQPAVALAAFLLSLPTRIADAVFTWQERIDERHRLMTLDDRALRDVGLSSADVTRETEKPFWTP
ncbi:MAG: DUF1127 domain-containing protein [Rhodospirillales bacterium]|nr:DUF1127 domain-containing protein [Rhodospirillales bacterium]